MAQTIIPHHKFKKEVLEYKLVYSGRTWLFGLISEKHIIPIKFGCWCGSPKDNRIHKPLRVDRF